MSIKSRCRAKLPMPEQWTDTSLLRCYAHHAVQCCFADAAMYDTLQGSSYAWLWFLEFSSSCFTSSISRYSHTLKRRNLGGKKLCSCTSTRPTAAFLRKLLTFEGSLVLGHHPKQTQEVLSSSLSQILFCFLYGTDF